FSFAFASAFACTLVRYVINKVIKGKEAVDQGKVISIEELEKEIETW
ncbi:hypothetical protein H8E88_29180, partial [candidate division KSB1 bacterium]|nr:hypothetical protein [candidate division KSB1 bacterium]